MNGNSENIFGEKTVKIEEVQKSDLQINLVENPIIDPIKFDIGL